MKLRTISLTAAAFLAMGALVFTACQRERDTDLGEPQDSALMERNADDIMAMTDQASTGSLSQFKKERGCAVVTIDSLSTPKSITIDFGSSNCLCQDGKNRRGKIIRTFTGKYKDPGSVHTITYDNYFVNDNQLKGIKTVTNNGLNTANNINYSIVTSDTLVKANNGGTVTWNSNRNREYTAGYNTAQWADDMYKVTGSANGTRANGIAWTMVITNALTIDHSCQYRITSGTMQVQPQNKALRTVDYGTGTCDNQATVTINNKVFTFNFK